MAKSEQQKHEAFSAAMSKVTPNELKGTLRALSRSLGKPSWARQEIPWIRERIRRVKQELTNRGLPPRW